MTALTAGESHHYKAAKLDSEKLTIQSIHNRCVDLACDKMTCTILKRAAVTSMQSQLQVLCSPDVSKLS